MRQLIDLYVYMSTVKRGEEGHGGEEGQSAGKCLDAKFYKPDKANIIFPSI